MSFESKVFWDLRAVQALSGTLAVSRYWDAAVPCCFCALLPDILCLENAGNFKLESAFHTRVLM